MTLVDRLKREEPTKKPHIGRPQELSEEVEKALVKCLKMCSEFQYPMRKRDLQNLVQSYCVEHNVKTRWVNDRPGKHWIISFKKRWSHCVRIKKPTNIKRSRAKVSPEDVRQFFTRVGPNLEGIPATHIFNYDESYLKDDPGSEEAFFSVGQKYHERAMNSSKVSFSIMFCCSAAGEMLPPMVIYKSGTGSVYQSWCEGGPDGACYAASKSGWFAMPQFNQWFRDVFVPYIRRLPLEETKVILGDNLSAHLSPYVTDLCTKYNVR
jgi:hypothetical protein